jgi:membrane protease YdiL (CAAX protease family)
MDILLNEVHELRSGWRFLAYWLLFFLILIAVSLVIPMGQVTTQLERLTLNTIPTIPAVVGALLLMARFVDHAPVARFGVTLHDRWSFEFMFGAVVALGMLGVVTIVNGAYGGVKMLWSGSDISKVSLVVTPTVLILSAAQEELVFRGYPLQVLMKAIGQWPAVWTMSAVFGVLHLRNPNATMLGAVNTMLAGVMLSIAYLKTRSLWLPYGLHLIWNLGLGFVLGYPLSGIKIDSLWSTVAGGPAWLVDPNYGPEGGLGGTVVFVCAAILIHRTAVVEVSPKIRAILSEH